MSLKHLTLSESMEIEKKNKRQGSVEAQTTALLPHC
jgi:hypothetical protein